MIIRDARKEEYAFIRAQRVAAYEQEHAKLIPEGHWLALKKAISSEADEQPGVEMIVAEIDGAIIGSVALFPAKVDAYEGLAEAVDYPEIRMLAVDTMARGKGAAKALIAECIERAKAKGCTAVGLHTGEFMAGAMNLYESLGFVRQPHLDFEPAGDGILVKGYLLRF